MEFSVEGFIHQGKVKVLYNAGTDAFDIYILNADGSTKEAIEEVYLDVLVDTIDRHVERCENYDQRIKDFYHLWWADLSWKCERPMENSTGLFYIGSAWLVAVFLFLPWGGLFVMG